MTYDRRQVALYEPHGKPPSCLWREGHLLAMLGASFKAISTE